MDKTMREKLKARIEYSKLRVKDLKRAISLNQETITKLEDQIKELESQLPKLRTVLTFREVVGATEVPVSGLYFTLAGSKYINSCNAPLKVGPGWMVYELISKELEDTE